MTEPLPIACDLTALSAGQRAREQALLAEFKAVLSEPEETREGLRFVVPADPGLLSRLGEFLALERLCCPFLSFELSVPPGRGTISLHVYGGPGAKAFLLETFVR